MGRPLTLCPQEYTGIRMNVTPCRRCSNWDKQANLCGVTTGAEHLPDEPPDQIPVCPIQDHCQHQLQTPTGPCVVRSKGLVCESALISGGMSRDDAIEHPLAFSAIVVATPEDIADHMARHGSPPEVVAAYLAKWAP